LFPTSKKEWFELLFAMPAEVQSEMGPVASWDAADMSFLTNSCQIRMSYIVFSRSCMTNRGFLTFKSRFSEVIDDLSYSWCDQLEISRNQIKYLISRRSADANSDPQKIVWLVVWLGALYCQRSFGRWLFVEIFNTWRISVTKLEDGHDTVYIIEAQMACFIHPSDSPTRNKPLHKLWS